MSISLILLVVLVIILLGAYPTGPHSRNGGYGPSGAVGLILASHMPASGRCRQT